MAEVNEHPYRQLLSAHALGALDRAEAQAVEAHLDRCSECRALLAEYRDVADGLLVALPPQSPPPRVRARLIAGLAPGQTESRSPVRPSWPWARAAAALTLAALLLLNLWTAARIRGLMLQQATLREQLRQSQTALALVAYPESRTLPVSGEQVAGSLVLNHKLNTGVLLAWGLAPLDTGQTYQAWLIQPDGRRVSAGVFRPEPGANFASVVISPQAPLLDYSGLGVTIEPDGGSPAPTGPRVLGVDF